MIKQNYHTESRTRQINNAKCKEQYRHYDNSFRDHTCEIIL